MTENYADCFTCIREIALDTIKKKKKKSLKQVNLYWKQVKWSPPPISSYLHLLDGNNLSMAERMTSLDGYFCSAANGRMNKWTNGPTKQWRMTRWSVITCVSLAYRCYVIVQPSVRPSKATVCVSVWPLLTWQQKGVPGVLVYFIVCLRAGNNSLCLLTLLRLTLSFSWGLKYTDTMAN